LKLSTRGEYGLRAMVLLSSGDDPVGKLRHAQDISSTQDIPAHYLKQILIRLRESGLVKSIRGPAGGHCLAKPASSITVGEILVCLEGEVTGLEAVLAMPCHIGVGPDHCVIKELLLEVKALVEGLLYSTTLADLVKRQCHLSQERVLVQPRFLNPCHGDLAEEQGTP
jgi:Rrf2 family protein